MTPATAAAPACELPGAGDAHTAPADDVVGTRASAEANLVADFTASAAFRAAFSNADPHKKPSTLASIERRWFAGKQTKRSADAVAAALRGVSSCSTMPVDVQLRLAGTRG
jgi:hypothetical protein|eukprot:COSAG02_NODE_8539_length_2532_cov_5.753706_2_plen_111_part_00